MIIFKSLSICKKAIVVSIQSDLWSVTVHNEMTHCLEASLLPNWSSDDSTDDRGHKHLCKWCYDDMASNYPEMRLEAEIYDFTNTEQWSTRWDFVVFYKILLNTTNVSRLAVWSLGQLTEAR